MEIGMSFSYQSFFAPTNACQLAVFIVVESYMVNNSIHDSTYHIYIDNLENKQPRNGVIGHSTRYLRITPYASGNMSTWHAKKHVMTRD